MTTLQPLKFDVPPQNPPFPRSLMKPVILPYSPQIPNMSLMPPRPVKLKPAYGDQLIKSMQRRTIDLVNNEITKTIIAASRPKLDAKPKTDEQLADIHKQLVELIKETQRLQGVNLTPAEIAKAASAGATAALVASGAASSAAVNEAVKLTEAAANASAAAAAGVRLPAADDDDEFFDATDGAAAAGVSLPAIDDDDEFFDQDDDDSKSIAATVLDKSSLPLKNEFNYQQYRISGSDGKPDVELTRSRLQNNDYTVDQLLGFIKVMNADIKSGKAHGKAPGKQIPISRSKKETVYQRVKDFVEHNAIRSGSASARPAAPEPLPLKYGEGIGPIWTHSRPLQKWIPLSPVVSINIPKIGQGVLSMARKSGTRHVKLSQFKNRSISKPFQEALVDMLQNRRLPDTSDLPAAERDYLYQILAVAQPEDILTPGKLNQRQKDRIKEMKRQIQEMNKAKRTPGQAVENKLNRLTALFGSVMAGNNNNESIIQEGTKLIDSLIRSGVIDREEGVRLRQKLR